MTRLLMLAGAGIAGVTIAFAAYAQSGPGHPGGGHMMMMMHHGMEAMDANKDGVITRDEFLSHPSQMFDHLDANHDGRLTKEELAAAHEQMRVCIHQGPGGAAAKDAPCPPMGPGGPMMMQHFQSLDIDHDGRVSFQELQEPLRQHFAAMDKNGNGFIDKDEIPSGPMMFEHHEQKH